MIPGLGRSPEKGKATHSSILAWRIPWTDSPWCHKEWDTTERLSYSLSLLIYNVVLALGVQQSDSVIYTFFSPRFFSLIDYYKILSIVSCAIQ